MPDLLDSRSSTDLTSYTPDVWTRAGLERARYVGFLTFDEFRATRATTDPGVYVILRESAEMPTFLEQSPAGKLRTFTEQITTLEQAWVPGAEVLYIGKATWGARRDGIHRRLKQYHRTGAGTADNHGGGVWIFQLEDASALRVCWRAAHDPSDEFVTALETHLIADFASRPEHGKWPFANRRD